MGFLDVPARNKQGGIAAPLLAGNYYTSIATTLSTRLMSQGNVYLARFLPGRTCTLNTIGVEVTTVGSAGALVRLGIYTLDWATGAIDRLVDAGTIDGTVVGLATLAVSVPVIDGQQLLLTAVGQGAPTTQTTLRGSQTIDAYWGFTSGLTAAQSTSAGVQIIGGATGALPASLSGPATIGVVPRVLVKAA